MAFSILKIIKCIKLINAVVNGYGDCWKGNEDMQVSSAVQVRALSPWGAKALLGITAGGIGRQHWVRHVLPLAHQRLLIFGMNPHLPGMACLHFVHAADGRTLLAEWRYRQPDWIQALHVIKAATVIWQVRGFYLFLPTLSHAAVVFVVHHMMLLMTMRD